MELSSVYSVNHEHGFYYLSANIAILGQIYLFVIDGGLSSKYDAKLVPKWSWNDANMIPV